MTRQEEINQKSALAKKVGFKQFMDNPTTRAMLSMVPPMENRDILDALFQSCFEQGYNAGVASVLIDVIESIIKKESK